MGMAIVLDEDFDNDDFPLLRADPILVDGSLALLDLGHSLGGYSGVPANGAALPNIAWEEAASVLGSGDATTLAFAFSDLHQVADAIVERTDKDGLHVVFSQTADTNGRGVNIRLPTPLEEYIFTNPNNDYYISRWEHITRAALSNTPESFSAGVYGTNASFLSNRLMGFYRSGYTVSGRTRSDPGMNTVGHTFRNVSPTAYTGTAPNSAANTRAVLMAWGGINGAGLSVANKHASSILHRIYVEDLTVSGRLYSEVDAIDHALWLEATGVGGRLNGEAFTDPATFP